MPLIVAEVILFQGWTLGKRLIAAAVLCREWMLEESLIIFLIVLVARALPLQEFELGERLIVVLVLRHDAVALP